MLQTYSFTSIHWTRLYRDNILRNLNQYKQKSFNLTPLHSKIRSGRSCVPKVCDLCDCIRFEMAQDNLSAVLYGINDLRLEQRPIPIPKDDEVLLNVEAVGICGSDVHYYQNGRIGPFVVDAPMVIGHEASGTVVRVGKDVTNLVPGDRVAIEPGVPCRRCKYCKTGRYNLCADIFFCATPPDHGNLTKYYCHAADFCHKIPNNMSFEEGVIIEPLSVSVYACEKGKVKIGSVVVIMGAGPIGLVTLLAAKAFGASKVLITDLVEHRLNVAKDLGADYLIKIERGQTEADIGEKILQLLGEAPSISIDCTGVELCIRTSLNITETGGTVVLVGMGKDEFKIPLTSALIREIDIKGMFRYRNNYPMAIEMVASKRINVNPLITHRFSMKDTLKAFDTAIKGEGNPIKIVIYPNKDTL